MCGISLALVVIPPLKWGIETVAYFDILLPLL